MELNLKKQAKLFFVNSTGEANEATKTQMLAYVKMVEFLTKTENIEWMATADARSLARSELNVFVTDESQSFQALASADSIVISSGTIIKCRLRADVDSSESTSIFQKLVITTSGLSEERRNEIRELILNNGGRFTTSFNSRDTDILITTMEHVDGQKFKAAEKFQKKCVTPDWVVDCVQKGVRLPFAKYEIRAERPKNKERSADTIVSTAEEAKILNGCTIWTCGFEGDELVKLFEMIDSVGAIRSEEPTAHIEYVIAGKPNLAELCTLETMIDSKIVTMEWLVECVLAKRVIDTTEFLYQFEASNLAVKTETVGEPPLPHSPRIDSIKDGADQPMECIILSDDESEPSCNTPPGSSQQKICLSGSIDAVEQRRLSDLIVKLGGIACDSTSFKPDCCMLLCGRPSLGEKTSSIIASGGWLLFPDYIESSYKAGHFLNERLYEWGNPVTVDRRNLLDRKTRQTVEVAHKLRRKFLSQSCAVGRPVGVFSDFRAILHTNRKDSYAKLLEAGRGVVVDVKQPYAEQAGLQGITHCFVDKRANALTESEKRAMKNAGIKMVTLAYLQACLLEENLPSEKEFAVK